MLVTMAWLFRNVPVHVCCINSTYQFMKTLVEAGLCWSTRRCRLLDVLEIFWISLQHHKSYSHLKTKKGKKRNALGSERLRDTSVWCWHLKGGTNGVKSSLHSFHILPNLCFVFNSVASELRSPLPADVMRSAYQTPNVREKPELGEPSPQPCPAFIPTYLSSPAMPLCFWGGGGGWGWALIMFCTFPSLC